MISVSAESAWKKIEALTIYQRLSAEMQLRPRLRETLNDPEPIFHLHNISAEPLVPGALALSNVPDGIFHKSWLGVVSSVEPEPPPPDQVAERIRRYVLFQGPTYSVQGAAEFPKAADTKLHSEMLMKGSFFELVDATVTVVGAEGKSWTRPSVWINKAHLVALYLG